MEVINFDHVSKRFVLKRDRRNSFHERVTGLFKPSLPDEEFWALRDISFSVKRGETLGLIGHNGSGKSTTLKLIARILEPSSGVVSVTGRISALLELGSGFHPDLTGRENIYLNGSLLGFGRQEMGKKIEAIIDFSEMREFIDMPVKHYSSGMYMRLGFAVAIYVDPDILITDEVLAVGDEAFARKCMDRIYALKNRGVTILFVSHSQAQVRALCDRALWFDHGVLMEDGPAMTVTDSYLEQTNLRDAARIQSEAEDVADADAAPAEEAVDPHRWGSREVEITRVEFLNRAGKAVRTTSTGEPLTLRMHYMAHERVEAPVFGLALHHRDGFHINGPNSRFNDLSIPEIEGAGYVDYHIDNLPLLEGDYLITVAVYDYSMSHAFDHQDRKWSLKVYTRSTKERFGAVYIPATWSWQPAMQLEEPAKRRP
jgi:lipopolysaccharide transport system ATP-binding protein